MAKGARGGKVLQDVVANYTGTDKYPAAQVETLSSDSKYLFKIGQKTYRRGSNPRQFLRAILSGSEADIVAVENQSLNNTYEYANYDVTTYHGPLESLVDAWLAAHPNK